MSFRGGRGGHGNARNAPAGTPVAVDILGWDGSTPAECIAFISRKCRISVSNYSVDSNTGVLRGHVRLDKDASDLVQWLGVRFAGKPLQISVGPAQAPASSGDNTIATLTMFLKSRYDPQARLLNLSAVQQDATLAAKGFFTTLSTSSKFFPALMKIAGDLKLDVTSADLSNNNLADLQTISTLAHTFPRLQNLLLQNNKIARARAFEPWKRKLNFLRELVLVGNPWLNTQSPAEVQQIKADILRVFPRLVIFNGEVLRNEQALAQIFSFPFGLPQLMFFQDAAVQELSTNFISNYINLWDSDRAGLMGLYQNESQFSLQVDLALPHTFDSSLAPDFSYYLPLLRNLTRVSSARVRVNKIAVGQEQIYKHFTQLPATKHELMTKPDQYSMESFHVALLGAICIVLHGRFDETAAPQNADTGSRPKHTFGKPKKTPLGSKSFDRTFIVIPGPNNSMVVASDLMCVRPETAGDAFKGEAAPAPAVTPAAAAVAPVGSAPPAATPSTADLPAELKTSLTPVQQELLVKVLVETKLNIQYGYMLCEQSSWDYQQCTVNFKNLAALLPPDAFAQV